MIGVHVCITDLGGETKTLVTARAGQTLMELARENAITGVVGDCGGGCACATCHVYVASDWWDRVGEPDDVEEAMLDMVADVRHDTSRLACQIRLDMDMDGLTVSVAPTS